MRKIYITDDGKKFDSEVEAIEYEKKLHEEAEKKKRISEEREKREKEIDAAFEKLRKLENQYKKDYGRIYAVSFNIDDYDFSPAYEIFKALLS